MIQRFFKADESVYEMVRLRLDGLWGLPSNGQVTCIEPAATAPRKGSTVYLGTWDHFCQYEDVAPLLDDLIFSGLVQEITKETYNEDVGPQAP